MASFRSSENLERYEMIRYYKDSSKRSESKQKKDVNSLLMIDHHFMTCIMHILKFNFNQKKGLMEHTMLMPIELQ